MILIRGAGDIASGIAVRLYRCGFTLAMTDLEKPTSIRDPPRRLYCGGYHGGAGDDQ